MKPKRKKTSWKQVAFQWKSPRWQSQRWKSPKGISMLEVIISIFIIALSAITTATVIVSAFRMDRVNKNKMIAINLAREGIEAVRNIRDSNWLRYSATRDKCWNFWEQPDKYNSSDLTTKKYLNCDTGQSNPIPRNTYFRVEFARSDLKNDHNAPYTYKWLLMEESSPDDPATDQETAKPLAEVTATKLNVYKLVYADVLGDFDGADGDGTKNNDTEQQLFVATSASPLTDSITTFYRQIYIQYLKENGTTGIDTDPIMQITSTVLWFENGRPQTIKFTAPITNYLEANT